MSEVQDVQTLLTGIAFGEQPRWHDGRLWFSDWGAREVIAVDLDGKSEVILQAPSFPFCVGWLPDGRCSSSRGARGSCCAWSPTVRWSLMPISPRSPTRAPGNEIVVDGRGNAYINGGGFDLMAGEEFAPGVDRAGQARRLCSAGGGGPRLSQRHAVTADNATLIVAESYAKRLTAFDIAADGGLSNRRVWAELGEGTPDGICIDAENAVWYADVPNQRCVRVREGGEVLQTVELDRGCFACALGGADRTTLFMMTTVWNGPAKMLEGPRTGQVQWIEAPAPGAGWP